VPYFQMYYSFVIVAYRLPIPVAALSKVLGRSLAGTVGSNSARNMDICLQ